VPRLTALFALAALAACATAPAPLTGYRDPAVPLYSNAVIQAADLSGDWQQVAGFIGDGGCAAGGQVSIGTAEGGLAVTGTLCLGGMRRDVTGAYQQTGPGRFQRGEEAAWWVIWADTSLRTLAIGTPDGRFGFVLNKGANLPSDRLNAAREVFDFNGYNTDLLQAAR
jgi:apolipoprotein D and lipocalin family protein